MLVGLKQILPKVFAQAVAEIGSDDMSAESIPLTNSVVTSDHGHVITYRFYGSGTWTKQSNNSFVIVFAWNGGCGGGSGSYGSVGGGVGSGDGGAGGAGGNSFVLMLPSYYFDTTTTITVGAGGNGGASRFSNNQAGLPGAVGGQTFVGGISVPIKPAGVGGGGQSVGGNPNAIGGTAGSSSYVMSGGYSIADGTQIGSSNNPTGIVNFAYNPTNAIIGSGTIRMPALPFAVATGGGGGIRSSSIGAGGTPGGSIELFGRIVTYGGMGAPGSPIGGPINYPIGGPGTYFAYPYGFNPSNNALQNNLCSMFVTGGTGGGGTGASVLSAVTFQGGGPGGIGAGGGGGGSRSGGGSVGVGSGPGGRGGQGLVLIFEFV